MVISTTVTLAQKRRAQAEEARIREMTAAVTTLRTAIGDYRRRYGRYPRSLNELPSIPRDPVTGSNATWQTEIEESVSADDFTAKSAAPEKVVVNVRSGAKGRDAHGKAWADY
jgi:type II secretory pathway pseudopilin PulG